MTPLDYVEVFKRIGQTVPIWNSVFIIIDKLVSRGEEKLIQTACVNAGREIIVDGIIGPDTIKNISMTDPHVFLTCIGDLLIKNKVTGEFDEKNDNIEDVIMKYLAKAEGLHLHWNSNEKSFTTMFGVYAYSFPKSEPVNLVKAIARRLGYKTITRHNVKDIDSKLTIQDRRNLRDSIYKFYVNNFMDERVNENLGNKSILSFFSISVNGGMSRGYKSLQYAIGVKVDGKFGKNSFKALKSSVLSDSDLNIKILDYMYSFYVTLARKPKFKRYFKGWVNRLIGLGYKRNV